MQLIVAIRNNYSDDRITDLLNLRETDINLPDNSGKTALMYAVLDKNIDKIRILMKYDAYIFIRDLKGKTAHAYVNSNQEILDELNVNIEHKDRRAIPALTSDLQRGLDRDIDNCMIDLQSKIKPLLFL